MRRADTQAVPIPSGDAARARAGCVYLGSASHGLFRGHLHPESWTPSRRLLLEFTGTWSAANRLPNPRRSARHESLSRITRQHECQVVPGQAFENRPWRGLHSGANSISNAQTIPWAAWHEVALTFPAQQEQIARVTQVRARDIARHWNTDVPREHLHSTEVGVGGTSQSSPLTWVHSWDTDLVELAFPARSVTARKVPL